MLVLSVAHAKRRPLYWAMPSRRLRRFRGGDRLPSALVRKVFENASIVSFNDHAAVHCGRGPTLSACVTVSCRRAPKQVLSPAEQVAVSMRDCCELPHGSHGMPWVVSRDSGVALAAGSARESVPGCGPGCAGKPMRRKARHDRELRGAERDLTTGVHATRGRCRSRNHPRRPPSAFASAQSPRGGQKS